MSRPSRYVSCLLCITLHSYLHFDPYSPPNLTLYKAIRPWAIALPTSQNRNNCTLAQINTSLFWMSIYFLVFTTSACWYSSLAERSNSGLTAPVVGSCRVIKRQGISELNVWNEYLLRGSDLFSWTHITYRCAKTIYSATKDLQFQEVFWIGEYEAQFCDKHSAPIPNSAGRRGLSIQPLTEFCSWECS